MKKILLLLIACCSLSAMGQYKMVVNTKDGEKHEFSVSNIEDVLFCEDKDDYDDILPVTETIINFEAYSTEKTTRASNVTPAFPIGTTMSVWGQKWDSNNEKKTLMNDCRSEYDDNLRWSYSPPKYWDHEALKYSFHAAMPYGVFSFDEKNRSLYITQYVANAHTESKEDLLVADEPRVEIGNDVIFCMRHILSRLKVDVTGGSGTYGYPLEVNSIKIFNLKNKGTFNQGLASATMVSNGTNTRWINLSDDRGQEAEYVLTSAPCTLVNESVVTALEALIIPQDLYRENVGANGSSARNEAYIRIEYTFNGEKFTSDYNLASLLLPSNNKKSLNEGWFYNIKIIISPNAIKFDTTVIYDWDDTISSGAIAL